MAKDNCPVDKLKNAVLEGNNKLYAARGAQGAKKLPNKRKNYFTGAKYADETMKQTKGCATAIVQRQDDDFLEKMVRDFNRVIRDEKMMRLMLEAAPATTELKSEEELKKEYVSHEKQVGIKMMQAMQKTENWDGTSKIEWSTLPAADPVPIPRSENKNFEFQWKIV